MVVPNMNSTAEHKTIGLFSDIGHNLHMSDESNLANNKKLFFCDWSMIEPNQSIYLKVGHGFTCPTTASHGKGKESKFLEISTKHLIVERENQTKP